MSGTIRVRRLLVGSASLFPSVANQLKRFSVTLKRLHDWNNDCQQFFEATRESADFPIKRAPASAGEGHKSSIADRFKTLAALLLRLPFHGFLSMFFSEINKELQIVISLVFTKPGTANIQLHEKTFRDSLQKSLESRYNRL
jgi:hypothetical protein